MVFEKAVTLVVSALSLLASGVMIAKALRRQRQMPAGEPAERQFQRFTRRRITMGIMVALVAVMLFLGTFVLEDWFRWSPAAFTGWWLAVIGVLVWLVVLAVADMAMVLRGQIDQRYLPPSMKGD